MSVDETLAFAKASFEDARRTIETGMQARGIPMPTDEEVEGIARDEAAERDALATDPLALLVDRCSSSSTTERVLLRAKADGPAAPVRSTDPERLEVEARRVFDAFEVIQWHRHQIPIKLRRALSSRTDGRDGRADANGPRRSR